MSSPKPWNLTNETPYANCAVFNIFKKHFEHPTDGRAGNFFVAHAPDWVIGVPVTRDGKIILVNQFRFGIRELSWEFPGGIIDGDESVTHAAAREIAEETGFTGDTPISLGNAASNPAIFNNHCHFVLVENCVKTSDTHFDSNEEIETRLCEPAEVLALAREGKIVHALMLSALSKAMLLRPDIFSQKN